MEYVDVASTAQPATTYQQNLTEGSPELVNGVWSQTWTISAATSEQISERITAQWSAVRADRNQRLASCDWTQLPDSPLNAEIKAQWVIYRQALRDVTQQPDPFAIVWPTAP